MIIILLDVEALFHSQGLVGSIAPFADQQIITAIIALILMEPAPNQSNWLDTHMC